MQRSGWMLIEKVLTREPVMEVVPPTYPPKCPVSVIVLPFLMTVDAFLGGELTALTIPVLSPASLISVAPTCVGKIQASRS